MSRIFTSFLIVIALLNVSVVAKAANVDVLAVSQTTNMLVDLTDFAPPKELSKSVPESSSDAFFMQDKTTGSPNFKATVFEGENYKFRETSPLKSIMFALICIGLIGFLAARRFKRAFV